MRYDDLFEDILSSLDPDDVPLEYIVLAEITDSNGKRRIIRGQEMAETLRGPARAHLRQARVVFNVSKIQKDVIDEVNIVYDQINDRLAELFPGDDDED